VDRNVPHPLSSDLTSHVCEGLAWLLNLVQWHEERFGEPEVDADFSLTWESGAGWWLMLIVPGHYAFEEQNVECLHEVVERAVAYYGHHVNPWEGGRGCQERHPIPDGGDGTEWPAHVYGR
jgi:hypothetical protein